MKGRRLAFSLGMIGIFLMGALAGFNHRDVTVEHAAEKNPVVREEAVFEPAKDELIRFHVLANSDSEEDQALKRAVRDAVLKEVSPQLAASQSLAESRRILQEICPEIERIGHSVVESWGRDYSVRTEFGETVFPTKSYGSLVLPAGNYEALRVVIGEGQGSNWWCVLFPPLCFVDIDQSTALPVDGKQGIPIEHSIERTIEQVEEQSEHNGQMEQAEQVKARFFFWEFINKHQ